MTDTNTGHARPAARVSEVLSCSIDAARPPGSRPTKGEDERSPTRVGRAPKSTDIGSRYGLEDTPVAVLYKLTPEISGISAPSKPTLEAPECQTGSQQVWMGLAVSLQGLGHDHRGSVLGRRPDWGEGEVRKYQVLRGKDILFLLAWR